MSPMHPLLEDTAPSHPPRPGRGCLRTLAGLLAAGALQAASPAATCTWTGTAGNGLWNDAKNWTGGLIPGAQDDVVLLAQAIRVTNNVTIKGLSAPPGTALTVQAAAMTATGPCAVDGSSLSVRSAGVLSLPGLTSWRLGNLQWATATWSVADTGSTLDLPALNSLGITPEAGNSSFTITAGQGARISFGSLTNILGQGATCCGGGSNLRLSASGARAVIEMPRLIDCTSETTSGSASLEVSSGAQILAPVLARARGTQLKATTATLDLPALAVLDGGGITLAAKGALRAPALSRADSAGLSVASGSVLSLPNLTSWKLSGVAWTSLAWSATDAGSVLELPNLGLLQIAADASNSSVDINAARGARISFASLTNILGQGGTCCGGGSGIKLRASGSGTLLSAPQLALDSNESGTSTGSIEVSDGAAFTAPRLARVVGTQIRATAATLDLPALQTMVWGGIALASQGALRAPALSLADNATFSVATGSILSLPTLTSWKLSNTAWTTLQWSVADAGSQLDFPNLGQIQVAGDTGNSSLEVNATRGAQLRFGSLTNLAGLGTTCCGGGSGIRILGAGAGTTVHLPALTNFSNFAGLDSASLGVSDGAVVVAPALVSTRGVTLTASRSTLSLGSLAVMLYGGISAAGNAVFHAPRLTSGDGTSFSVASGSELTLPGLVTWQASDLAWVNRSWTVADPRSRLNLPNLSEIRLDRSCGQARLEVSVSHEGAMTLPLLQRILVEGGDCGVTVGVSGVGSSASLCALVRAETKTAGISRFSAADKSFLMVPSSVGRLNFDRTTTTGGQIVDCALHSASIARQPRSQSVYTGDPLSLSVETAGDLPATFQWYRDGVLIPSATSNRYVVAAASPPDAGTYTVRVGTPTDVLVSQAATVSLLPARSSYLTWAPSVFSPTDLLDPAVSGPEADPDRDGLTNAQEEALDTDPRRADTDGDSVQDLAELQAGSDPNLTASVPSDGFVLRPAIELRVRTVRGTSYQVQTTTNLLRGWSPATGVFPGSNTVARFYFSSPTNGPIFFRLLR